MRTRVFLPVIKTWEIQNDEKSGKKQERIKIPPVAANEKEHHAQDGGNFTQRGHHDRGLEELPYSLSYRERGVKTQHGGPYVTNPNTD